MYHNKELVMLITYVLLLGCKLLLLALSSMPLVPVASSHSYKLSWVVRRQSWFMLSLWY
jgi:hypothetical protein